MKLKKVWDLGITVFVVIFIYFLLKEYFPVITYDVKAGFINALQVLKQGLSNFL